MSDLQAASGLERQSSGSKLSPVYLELIFAGNCDRIWPEGNSTKCDIFLVIFLFIEYLLNFETLPLLTSSILVAQVGEPPDISEVHGEADD